MRIEKPITVNVMKKANTLFYAYMSLPPKSVLTKDQIAVIVGVKNERSAREVISALAKRVPVIATSDARGYWIARTMDDIDDVRHAWQELDSRVEDLEALKRPLMAFIEKARGKVNG